MKVKIDLVRLDPPIEVKADGWYEKRSYRQEFRLIGPTGTVLYNFSDEQHLNALGFPTPKRRRKA